MKGRSFLFGGLAALVSFISPSPVCALQWGGDCVSNGVATIGGLSCLLQRLLSVILPVLGLASGIMFLVAGFQLIGGGSEGAQKAKGTITWAVGGIVFAFLSWFILRFVESFTGVNVTQFNIGN